LQEINKIKNKSLHDAEQRARRERMLRQKNAPAEQAAAKQQKKKNPLDYDEKVVLRYLMLYGEKVLYHETTEDDKDEEKPVTVGEYIINELRNDDIVSDEPLHNIVLELYENAEKGEGFTAWELFVNNPNVEISKLASDIIGKEYELSRIHEKFGSVQKEDELLIEHVPKVVTELRLKKTKVTIKQLRDDLKKAEQEGRFEDVVSLMKEIKKWEHIKSHISKELGGRTIV
jgi:DNA primase